MKAAAEPQDPEIDKSDSGHIEGLLSEAVIAEDNSETDTDSSGSGFNSDANLEVM